MKKKLLAMSLVVPAAMLFLAGCVERRVVYVQTPPPATAGQVVYDAPPPAQQEVVVAAPGPEYVWAPGYWSWQGRWVWMRGSWVVRPRPHAVFVPGQWVHRGHGYVWIGGHWR